MPSFLSTISLGSKARKRDQQLDRLTRVSNTVTQSGENAQTRALKP